MRDSDSLPLDSLLDSLLDRQKQSWLEGRRPAVEELLSSEGLDTDPEALLDLVYNEIVVREELGEEPALSEYLQRYPHLSDELKLHFEVHAALRGELLHQTQFIDDGDTAVERVAVPVTMGPRVEGYEVVGRLGQGGMGIVYKARHLRLKRNVALKMFQPGRRPSPRELIRFRTEAEAVARLQHPNIVQVFDVGDVDGLPYLTLELAEGGTLAERLKAGPLEYRVAAELVRTLALAIQHAHEKNIVHRDLKPANVLFARNGEPKITDFGLAKILEDDDAAHDATRSGEPIGTPRYMSPEQACGRSGLIGPATDVHALGMILYECLTGHAPFVAGTVVETLHKIRDEVPSWPQQAQPAMPRDLETICSKCLQKQPHRRYATAAALADDLRRCLANEPIRARPTPRWERAWLWVRRHPQHAALAGVVGFLAGFIVLGGIAWRVHEWRRIEAAREEVIGLMHDGKEAWERKDHRAAKTNFETAWSKVVAEPALADLKLNVGGWLDEALRETTNSGWLDKKRRDAERQDRGQ